MTRLRRAVVTGAGGLLGGCIVRELLRDGCEVLGLDRDLARAQRFLPARGLHLVQGDVNQMDAVADLVRGADAVFHTAALVSLRPRTQADRLLLYKTNVRGAVDVVRVAAELGIPVVVHTSSMVTPSTGDAVGDQSTPIGVRHGNDYYESKAQAEAAIRTLCERHDVRVPMILPGWLWGPGDAGQTSSGRLFLAVAKGEMRVIPRANVHVVDVRDVAEASVAAAVVGVSMRRYVVAGMRRNLWEACCQVARETCVPRPRAVPMRIALAGTTVMQAGAAVLGRAITYDRTSAQALRDEDRLHVSSVVAERELGVAFRPFTQTVSDQAAWYREHNLLPAGPAAGRHRMVRSR